MKNFKYNIPTNVFFGEGAVDNIGKEIKKYSERVLIVYGSERIKKEGLFGKIADDLKENGITFFELAGVKPNPSITSVRDGIKIIEENNLDFILAVGGGSAIDAAKAMAVGAAMKIDPWKVLKQESAVEDALLLASVLTLAATGTEMNGNSVISNEETGEKLAFGSDLCRPVFSVLDPTLTFSVPKDQTAAGAVDIFTHVAEQYFDKHDGGYLQDRMSEAVMKTCIHYGRIAVDNPEDYEARANLMWASSVALNSILSYGKNGGDWATHMMEHELSAAYDITHAVGLAILLPNWMKFVLSDETVDRFAMFAENVWGIKKDDKFAQAEAGIEATLEFFKSLDIETTLAEVDIDNSKLDHMANQCVQFGPVGGYRSLEAEDVKKIYEMSL